MDNLFQIKQKQINENINCSHTSWSSILSEGGGCRRSNALSGNFRLIRWATAMLASNMNSSTSLKWHMQNKSEMAYYV